MSILHGILREHEAGVSVTDLSRRHGVSEQTIERWKQQYGGMETSERRRLKQLEAENVRLKKLVADQALDNQSGYPLAGPRSCWEKRGDAGRTARGGGALASARSYLRPLRVPTRWRLALNGALPATA